MGYAEVKVIYRPANNLRKENPDSVIAEDANRPPDVSPAIFLEIGD
jgi:hypothetical protein